jgi:hypothetical protein
MHLECDIGACELDLVMRRWRGQSHRPADAHIEASVADHYESCKA